MDRQAIFFFLALFLVFLLVMGGIMIAGRTADARATSPRTHAARAEKDAQADRTRAGTSHVDKIDADDDAADLLYDKVPKQFLYTKQQAATALAMSPGHLNELIRDGKIRAVKDGSRVKLTTADLQAYVDSLPSLVDTPPAERPDPAAAEPEQAPGTPRAKRKARPAPAEPKLGT
jgi:excisionase family DNA binding protein